MKNEKTQNQGTEDTESHTPSDNEDKNNTQEGEEITFEEATERGKI